MAALINQVGKSFGTINLVHYSAEATRQAQLS